MGPVDHILIIFTLAGQMNLAAFTNSLDECHRIKEAVSAVIEVHNQDIKAIRRAQKVEVMMVCQAVPERTRTDIR